jgi:WD40 repeat protein
VSNLLQLKNEDLVSLDDFSNLIVWDTRKEFEKKFYFNYQLKCEKPILIELNRGHLLSLHSQEIHIWNENYDLIKTYEYEHNIEHICKLSNGEILVSPSQSLMSVITYNLAYSQSTVPIPVKKVKYISELRDKTITLAAGKKILIYSKSFEHISTLKGHSGLVTHIMQMRNNHIVSSSFTDKSLRIWRNSDFTCVHIVTRFCGMVPVELRYNELLVDRFDGKI